MLTMFDIVHFVLDHDHSPKHMDVNSARRGLTRFGADNLLKAVITKSAFAMVRVVDVLDRARKFVIF